MRVFTLFFLILSKSLFSLDYGLDYQLNPSEKIDFVQIFAERHSGSFYMRSLLAENFSLLGKKRGYCHKHFPPWIGVDPKINDFPEKSKRFLTVVVFRNPYDYIRGMRKIPWHADRALFALRFSSFIRKPWKLAQSEVNRYGREKVHFDSEPLSGKPFKNVMALRTAKIKQMLGLKEYCHNIYYINYEVVLKNEDAVLKEIASLFSIQKMPKFKKIEYYKGNPELGRYVQKKYKPISQQDLDFINKELDEELENQIGYQIIRKARDIK